MGAYSLELYEKWANRRGVSNREIKKVSDVLRTAAILHDVGKVAVSDMILKKPGQLTYDEKLAMRKHTILGARLFKRTTSFWDYMASEVALNHHENWDGSGYPGQDRQHLRGRRSTWARARGPPRSPSTPRVVSISDVYDALVSQRAYKMGWRQEHALRYIRYQAGKKFDPELVSIFLKMGDLLTAIEKKYSLLMSGTRSAIARGQSQRSVTPPDRASVRRCSTVIGGLTCICQNCGKELSDQASFCPSCGHPSAPSTWHRASEPTRR